MYIDNWDTVRGVKSKRFADPKGENIDLWWRLGQAVSNLHGSLEVEWIKSHPSEEYLLRAPLDLHHYLGNALADVFAKEGAKRAEANLAVVGAHDARAYLIQRRLIAIGLIEAQALGGDEPPKKAADASDCECQAEKTCREIRARTGVLRQQTHMQEVWGQRVEDQSSVLVESDAMRQPCHVKLFVAPCGWTRWARAV